MAEIQLVEPVIRICAVISRYEEVRSWGIQTLSEAWGNVFLTTEPMPFHAGGYYQSEMGEELVKTLVAFESPCDPTPLADWKLATNGWEEACAAAFDYAQKRPLNLDCGYVTQAKLVLATTKDRDHRIYLRNGIFAEVTLNYVHKEWVSHRWTYPDYRTDTVKQFTADCRAHLRKHLKETGLFRKRV
nr:DUF4416 family protein [Novipirellula aureliae]